MSTSADLQQQITAIDSAITQTNADLFDSEAREQTEYQTKEDYRAAYKLAQEAHQLTMNDVRGFRADIDRWTRLKSVKQLQFIYYQAKGD